MSESVPQVIYQPKRLWNSKYIHLFCLEVALQLGVYLANPLVSQYAILLGAPIAIAGLLAGMSSTVSIFARSVSGVVSDRLSKKSLLVLVSALFVVSAFGCAVVQHPVALGIFRAIQGAAFAFKSAIVVSMIPLVVPKDRVGSAVGWFSMALTMGLALGPAIGSYVSSLMGYPTSFALSGCLLLVGLVLVTTFRAPASAAAHRMDGVAARASSEQAAVEGRQEACAGVAAGRRGVDSLAGQGGPNAPVRRLGLRDRLRRMFYFPVLPLTLVAGLVMSAQGITVALILLVGELKGMEGASLYFTAYALVTLVTKPAAGRLTDQLGLSKLVVPMALIAACGMVLLAFGTSVIVVVGAAVCMGLGQGPLFSAMQAESMRNVDEAHVGRAANTFYLGPDVGMGIAPFVGGVILQVWGATALFLFNAVLLVLAAVLFWTLAYPARARREAAVGA